MLKVMEKNMYFHRYERNLKIIESIAQKAIKQRPDFTILCYGSTAYGWKENSSSRFDDIDLLVVLGEIDLETFVAQIKQLFYKTVEIYPEHIQCIIEKKFDVCRMYVSSYHARIGIRIINPHVFKTHNENMTKNWSTIAPIGGSRIIQDYEWSYKTWQYVPIILNHGIIKIGDSPVSFTAQYLFATGEDFRLGVLARKLLTSIPVYITSKDISLGIDRIWTEHKKMCEQFKKNATKEDIVNCIYRSERFSDCCRGIMYKKISMI